MKHPLRSLCLSMALLAAAFSPAGAAYPEKPVTFIIPFAAGGAGDQQARLIEKEFAREFGQPVNVVFRTGADGAIAATEVKGLPADGYTIGVHTHPLMLLNTSLGKGRYSVDDFDYLCGSTVDQVLLITAKDSPVRSLEQLVEFAKKSSRTVTLGTVDVLGQTQIPALKLKAAGVNVKVVPMAGGAKALVALLGGHLDALMAAKGNTMNTLSKVNVLAVCSEEPDPDLPGVPTLKSLGYDITSSLTRLWYAPKGLPADVKQRLIEGMKKIYHDPEVIKKHAAVGMPVIYTDPDTLYKKIKALEKETPELLKLYKENR